MCGIFGVVLQSDAVPDEQQLARTAGLLAHRGPDGRGCFAEPGVGLVHTRLSLLDPGERSGQPFWARDQRFALVYNGEIYNYADLRAELEDEGAQFRTTSDTEVLFEALLRWGPQITLPRLEGMFAFGLYDRAERTLLLARDRFGIKPLFTCRIPGGFIFASEIAALRPWVRFEADLPSISAFLYGYAGPHRGHTFFRNIRHTDPAAVIQVQHGRVTSSGTFFSVAEMIDPDLESDLEDKSDAELVDVVDGELTETVKNQLVADAPVGGLCSGGVDSSLLLAIAARFHNNLAVFHADIAGPLSELSSASALAKHLKLDLQTVSIRDRHFVERMPDVVEHYGHPYYPNPHSVPFLMVSELVRANKVKAVLTGEGADECYLGYPWLAPNVHRTFKTRGLRASLAELLGRRRTPDDDNKYWGPTWEADVLPAGFRKNQHALVTALHNRFEIVAEARETRNRVERCGDARTAALKSLDLLQYNLRTLLHRNDALGMAASIEARFPYLDSAFVRTSVNMPFRSKIRFAPTYLDPRHYFFMDKWLLRHVAARYLPCELSHRPKVAFSTNAADRIVIDPHLFEGGHVPELFDIGSNGMRFLLEEARQPLKLRLLQLEIWSSLFLRNMEIDTVRENVTRWVKVAAVLLLLASLSAAPGVRIRTPRTGRTATPPAPATACVGPSEQTQG